MISKTWSSTCYSSYEFDLVTGKVKIICATKTNCKYSILIWNFSQLKIDWLIWNFIELYIHFEHALWNLKFGEIKFPNFINMCHKIMILWHKFQISYTPTLLSLLLGYFLIQLKKFSVCSSWFAGSPRNWTRNFSTGLCRTFHAWQKWKFSISSL